MNTFHTPLFVFEMANNHMGNVDHGRRIVREIDSVTRDMSFQFAFKLQYRDLDTFIHPGYRQRKDIGYVKRFCETRLGEEEFLALLEEIRACRFYTMCTPFDEKSVDQIERHRIDIIKIASCSFTDWPLLERIARTSQPIVASTGGSTVEEIDRVVKFLEHRHKTFALMHCVAKYPTAAEDLQLNQIDWFRTRYPQVPIGFSTHEPPDNLDAIKIAIAKGAQIFEKHVGFPTDNYRLNSYSANPSQVRDWLKAAQQTYSICGRIGNRANPEPDETGNLFALRRGVYARKPIKPGEAIEFSSVFLAKPAVTGQLTANDLSKFTEFVATAPIAQETPVMEGDVTRENKQDRIIAIIRRVRDLLRQSGAAVPNKVDVEISHHYGLDRFEEVGLTLVNVVNREYCKKIIILLPGQKHPEQYHKLKEETFCVIFGEVNVYLNGQPQTCREGDVLTVERGVRHALHTTTGAVIEEISSTHYRDDSYYTDPAIALNSKRKTCMTYWLD